MKKYIKAEVEIIELPTEEVVRTSGEDPINGLWV